MKSFRAVPIVSDAVIILSVAVLPSIATAEVPRIDIRQTCQAAANVMKEITQGSFDLCLEAEQRANVQLKHEWDSFSAADKKRCVQPTVYLPSYVEWLTCLETQRDARNIRHEDSAPTTSLKRQAPIIERHELAVPVSPATTPPGISAAVDGEQPLLPIPIPRPGPQAAMAPPGKPNSAPDGLHRGPLAITPIISKDGSHLSSSQ